MSDPEILPPESGHQPAGSVQRQDGSAPPSPNEPPTTPGPSLGLLYSLLALAFAAAIALALLIVLPFYRRR